MKAFAGFLDLSGIFLHAGQPEAGLGYVKIYMYILKTLTWQCTIQDSV